MFDPLDYIETMQDGMALCKNPLADGGLTAMTVNINLDGERKRFFQDSIRRMVLAKLINPKFAEVILVATDMEFQSRQIA
ncbi:MAG: hypothetical protein U1E36_04470 [Rickettsiales bacterium]